jgi:hypothetical protein
MDRDPVTERIIGCTIEVHRALGPGLLESAYEKCLAFELGQRGIPFRQQLPVRECQKFCVRAGCIDQSLKTNRSPNWIASWALAACHAGGGRFQFCVMCRSASQISLVAA